MSKLIMFHARECPHCKRMMPLVDRLEEKDGISMERLEVWHNEENADLMRTYKDVLRPQCGGQLRTPTFFNPETGKAICGEMDYEELKAWAEEG